MLLARAFALLLLCACGAAAQPTCFVTHPVSPDCPNISGDTIFSGRVVSITETDRKTGELKEIESLNGYWNGREVKAVVAVGELFKGEAEGTVEVAVISTGCYGQMSKGGTYIFHLGDEPPPRHAISWSFALESMREEEVAKIFEKMRALLRGEREPSLFGNLTNPEQRTPFAGLTVVAESGGAEFESRADADGRYEFRELPAGMYKVYPRLPPSLSLPEGSTVESRVGREYVTQIYKDNVCGVRRDFPLLDTGAIGGRAEVADTKHFILVRLYLKRLPEEPRRVFFSKDAVTLPATGGDFSFTHVPPGRYIVEAEVADDRSRTLSFYYPGVASRKDALEIKLDAGRALTGLVFKLPRAPDK